jgi:branched-chain amino acid transport system substrate-binding protein
MKNSNNMNKSKRIFTIVIIIIVIIVVGSLVYMNSQKKQDDKVIKIGAILPFTGDGSIDALNVKRGLELAKTDILSSGIKVDINYQDDKTNPQDSVSSINYLYENYHPDAIVGPIWSFLEDSAAPVIDQENLISYSPASTSEIVSVKSSNIFYGTIKNERKTEPVYKFLKENNKKSVAIIVSQDSWGKSHELAYQKAAELAHAKVVLIERVPFGLEDNAINTILLKVKSSKADVLLWTGYNDGALQIIKKTEELGLNIPIVGTEGFTRVARQGLVNISGNQQIYSLQTKLDPEFINKFKSAYNEEPGTYSDAAYDGLMILIKGISESKKQGISLKEYLKNNFSYDGYAGHYQFDQNNDRINGGEWTLERVK